MYNLAQVKEKTYDDVKLQLEKDRREVEKALHAYHKNKILTPEQEIQLECVMSFNPLDKDVKGFLEKCSNNILFRNIVW